MTLEIAAVILTAALTIAVVIDLLLTMENIRLREALRRFADISLIQPWNHDKLSWDILNARKVLGGKKK